MTASIVFGTGHCCMCAGVCHHIGPPSFCARHSESPLSASPAGGIVWPQVIPAPAPRCHRCGHTPSFHGATFCLHESGYGQHRKCDCEGWQPDHSTSGGTCTPFEADPTRIGPAGNADRGV